MRIVPATDLPVPALTEAGLSDREVAEQLQDRLRREEQTARALRAYLVEHPTGRDSAS